MALTRINNNSLSSVTAAGLPTLTADKMPEGAVIQTKYTTKKSVQTISQGSNDYLDGLTLTLTPASSSSDFYIQFAVAHASSLAGSSARMFSIYRKIGTGSFTLLTGGNPDTQSSQSGYLIKTSGVPGLSDLSSFNGDHGMGVDTGFYLDSPSTTSDVTYRIYLKQQSNANTLYVNKNNSDANSSSDWESRSSSHMSVMEIAGA